MGNNRFVIMITCNYVEVKRSFTGVELEETLRTSHTALNHLSVLLDDRQVRFVGINKDEVSLSDYRHIQTLISLIKSSVVEVENLIDNNLFYK